MAFTTLVLAQLAYVFAVRAKGWPPVAGRNWFLYLAVAGSAMFVVALLAAPPLHDAFDLVSLDAYQLLVVAALALIPFAALTAFETWRHRRRRHERTITPRASLIKGERGEENEVSSGSPERIIDRTTRHLIRLGIPFKVVEHEQAFTAASEADAAGTRPENAAKSVMLHDGEGYRLSVIQASDRLDLGKVRNLLGVSRADLRLATEPQLAGDFPELELGAIPPLGEMLPVPEIVDRHVLDHDRVLCNGGDHAHSLLLDPNDILRASEARVADVRQD